MTWMAAVPDAATFGQEQQRSVGKSTTEVGMSKWISWVRAMAGYVACAFCVAAKSNPPFEPLRVCSATRAISCLTLKFGQISASTPMPFRCLSNRQLTSDLMGRVSTSACETFEPAASTGSLGALRATSLSSWVERGSTSAAGNSRCNVKKSNTMRHEYNSGCDIRGEGKAPVSLRSSRLPA